MTTHHLKTGVETIQKISCLSKHTSDNERYPNVGIMVQQLSQTFRGSLSDAFH